MSCSSGSGATSTWVYPGADGKLAYKATPAGDRIMDFSHAGYGGGGVPLPHLPVVVTVPANGSSDDTLANLGPLTGMAGMIETRRNPTRASPS